MIDKGELKQEMKEAFSDLDIHQYLPDAPIKKYCELAQYKDISELLPDTKSYCILLYEDSLNHGHWIVISKPEDNKYEFFCSYGSYPDAPLKWVNPTQRSDLGVKAPYLSLLFEKCPEEVVYSKVKYQKDGGAIADCGRFCILRTLKMIKGLNLNEFHAFMKKERCRIRGDFDMVVTALIP